MILVNDPLLVGLPAKKVLEEPIDDSLHKGKQIASKEAGETHIHSPPKQIDNQEEHTMGESDDEDQ